MPPIKIVITMCMFLFEVESSIVNLVEEIVIAASRSLELPSSWIGRNDVFDLEQDLQSLFVKSKVSGILPFKNNTNAFVTIRISGYQHLETSLELQSAELELTIPPGETIRTVNFSAYKNIQLNPESLFFNFYSTAGQFEISIETIPFLLFPRPLNSFPFFPVKETEISDFPTERQPIILNYRRGHLHFFEDYVCSAEGITPKDLYDKRRRLYEAFKLESIIERPLANAPKIPLNLFWIWLIDPSNPRDPPLQCIELAKVSARNNPRSAGWNHYFLVQNPALLPETAKALEGTDIQLVKFSDLLGPLELQEQLDCALAEFNFGKASDILRVAALITMGGACLDIDFVLFHSLKVYFYLYHSLFGLEPSSEFIGNAFMAAFPNHPVMQEMTRLIKRNFKKRGTKKFYSEMPAKKELRAIFQTGPCVATIAFHNMANVNGNIDIAMPPEVFFPGKSLNKPELEIPKFGDSMRLTTASLHLWKNTWLS